MTTTGLKMAGIFVLASSMIACGDETTETETETVSNQDLWANITVVSTDGTSSIISVDLNIDGELGSNLSLSTGDSLEAIAEEETVTLERDDDATDVIYQGELATGASDTLVQLNLTRTNNDDITGTQVNLPKTFVIDFPQNEMIFTDLNDFEIVWTAGASGNSVELTETAICKNAEDEDVEVSRVTTVADDGSFPTDFLSTLNDTLNDKGCDFIISLERSRNGELSEGFGAGGAIVATQKRDVSGLSIEL